MLGCHKHCLICKEKSQSLWVEEVCDLTQHPLPLLPPPSIGALLLTSWRPEMGWTNGDRVRQGRRQHQSYVTRAAG